MLGFISIAFLSNYTMKILVLTKYKYRDEGRKCETFMDIGTLACGWGGRLAVQAAQIGSQVGTCSVYIVYIAQVCRRRPHALICPPGPIDLHLSVRRAPHNFFPSE